MFRSIACPSIFAGVIIAGSAIGGTLASWENQDEADIALELPHGFDLIPADARAAVIIPNLKRASDDLTHALEGMERAEMLVGARPIDQLRAAFGLQAGVHENGSAVVIFPANETSPPIFLVPVTNSADFLEANFDPVPGGPANAHLAADGSTLFSKALAGHVALSTDAATVESFEPSAGLSELLAPRLGDRARQVMKRGEVMIYSDAGMAAKALAEQPVTVPFMDQFDLPLAIFDSVDAGVTVLDFDPLCLGVSSFLFLNPDSPAGQLGATEPREAAAFSHLPAKPFFIAGSIDLRALGGIETFSAMSAGLFDIPEWIGGVRAIEFAASPSPLGLQGGLFNEMVIFFETDDPAGALEFMRQNVLASAVASEERTIVPKWEQSKREIEGVSVDAFEIAVENPMDQPIQQIIRTTVFGRRGINGFVGAVDSGLIVTMSQRPDVFAAAVQARRNGPALATDEVIAQMRTWLPPDSDMELFIGIGQFGKVLNQFAGAFGLGGAALPTIDPETKPIAMAADVQDGIVETGLVIPSDVMAILFDQLVDYWMAAEERMTGSE